MAVEAAAGTKGCCGEMGMRHSEVRQLSYFLLHFEIGTASCLIVHLRMVWGQAMWSWVLLSIYVGGWLVTFTILGRRV